MAIYSGGCHCGAVRFTVEADLNLISECNCSMCTKKGALHHRVKTFTLTSGEDVLSLYQFGEKIAKHWFCRHCGIHAFTNPRAAPNKISINLRCLDDFHTLKERLVIQPFDGQHWETAVTGFTFE